MQRESPFARKIKLQELPERVIRPLINFLHLLRGHERDRQLLANANLQLMPRPNQRRSKTENEDDDEDDWREPTNGGTQP